MIITRTPLRISFSGGGSDMAGFYERHEGCVLSASINKYMYIMIHPSFNREITTIKYSRTENVTDIRHIKHRIAKQVLLDYGLSGVELVSIADVPAGTGLASSSAYTVGTLHTINAFMGKYRSQESLAEEACETEIDKLGEPIGKQDQYGCAVGGIKFIRFMKSGHVEVEPLALTQGCIRELEDNLLLFYTGLKHSAAEILDQQQKEYSRQDKFDSIVRMTELAYELREALTHGELDRFGQILHKGWILKRNLNGMISNGIIDKYYDLALENGAAGGKLLGAGGGGFYLFYCEKKNQNRLRCALNDLVELPFGFDFGGTSLAYVGNKDWD